MKKSVSLMLTGALLSALFTGCASTSFSIAESGPYAIMSVSSNVNVPYYSDEVRDDEYGTEDGLISNAVNKFLGKNNPEIISAEDRVNLASDRLKALLEENGGVQVIDYDKVIESQQYSSIKEGLIGFTDVKLRAYDYKSIDSIGSKKARLLMKETDSKNLIFATFTFKKRIVKGSKLGGQICAYAAANFSVYNERGKNIINDDFEVQSAETIEISKLSYDKDELVELFPDLIDQLINQFIVKYM